MAWRRAETAYSILGGVGRSEGGQGWVNNFILKLFCAYESRHDESWKVVTKIGLGKFNKIETTCVIHHTSSDVPFALFLFIM